MAHFPVWDRCGSKSATRVAAVVLKEHVMAEQLHDGTFLAHPRREKWLPAPRDDIGRKLVKHFIVKLPMDYTECIWT